MQKKDGQIAAAQALEFLFQLKAFNELGRKIAGENRRYWFCVASEADHQRHWQNMEFSDDMIRQGAAGPELQR